MMRTLTIAIALSAISLGLPGRGHAIDYQPQDMKNTKSCLEKHTEPRNCFFKVVEPCMEVEIKRAANKSQAKAWCELREIAVWREIGKIAVVQLETRLPEPELSDFKAILKNWEADEACQFRSKYYRPMYWFFTEPTMCELRKTHFEVETLLDYEAMMKQKRFEFQRDKTDKK